MPETLIESFDEDAILAVDAQDEPSPHKFGLSLFWRTFFLLALLLLACILAWLQTLRSLQFEPQAIQSAKQLIHADGIGRISLLHTMGEEEGLYILPRNARDQYVSVSNDAMQHDMALALQEQLGKNTVIAKQVNGRAGLWVSFDMDGADYWFLTDFARFQPVGGKTWIIWLTVAASLSLAGAALFARLINRPLKALSFAASRVREGDFNASQLDEHANTSEIREVNIGFNRMAQRLAKLDQDRAVMLAGISHDLRTPLARLRLETELSVSDLEARAHMAMDIAQLDAIIDKFLDYARPDKVKLSAVVLADLLEACTYSYKALPDVHLQLNLERKLVLLADEVELGRIVSNLLENARKYGKSTDTGIARITISAIGRDEWVFIKIRDHGPGVAPDQLANLTKPFYRGEAARTEAKGAGLGLAIVEKTVQRMGGGFALNNSSTGGLSANLKLQRAPSA